METGWIYSDAPVLKFRNRKPPGTPNSTLVYLEDAGHNVYHDRPDAFFESVRSFLRGDDTIPSERHDTSVPDGYQGPP